MRAQTIQAWAATSGSLLLVCTVTACAVAACTVESPSPGSGSAGTAGGLPLASASGGGVGGMGTGGIAGIGTGGVSGAAGIGMAGTGTGGGAGVAGATTGGIGGMGTGGTAGIGTGGASGTAGMGTGGMGSGGMGGSASGTVTVELTTVSYDGEYAPLNYGAVWFEKADGTFVKTVKRWAGTTHATDLVAWTEASGGWGSIFGGGNAADMMDAMSSATIRTHQMHTITWNMMDSAPALVADGDYVAVLEMSESRARDRDGPILRIPFTKGPMPQTVEPTDQEGFTGVVLRYEP